MVSRCEVKWPRSCPSRWTVEDTGSLTRVWRSSIAPSCTERSGRKMSKHQAFRKRLTQPTGLAVCASAPRPPQRDARAVPRRGRRGDSTPRCGCLGALTLHEGAERLAKEPGSGGKKCLLQLLRRPLGPRGEIWAKGPPWKPLLGPCFLQAFVTKVVLFQTPAPHLGSSSIFVKRRSNSFRARWPGWARTGQSCRRGGDAAGRAEPAPASAPPAGPPCAAGEDSCPLQHPVLLTTSLPDACVPCGC